MTGAKFISAGIDNKISHLKITDDESVFVLSNVTRVAAIKLVGAMSRSALAEHGLDEREIEAILRFYHVLQT